jgi:hypothetical protein
MYMYVSWKHCYVHYTILVNEFRINDRVGDWVNNIFEEHETDMEDNITYRQWLMVANGKLQT